MNWSRELVAEYIPQSRIKRNPTREVAPRSAKQLPSDHIFSTGVGVVRGSTLLRYVYTSTTL